jgi:hypothetical protein
MANTVSAPRPGSQWNVGSSYTKAYVSPAALHDRPEVLESIFDYDTTDLFSFMMYAGKLKQSGNVEFFHAEHDARNHMHTTSGAPTGTGAGVATTVTLTTGTGDHLNTGTLSRPLVNDQGMAYTASGIRRFVVTAVNKSVANAHTATLKPTNATVDLGTETVTGTKIVFFSSAFGDGTGMPGATSRLPVTQSNYIQTFKKLKSSDGRQAATETWWKDPKTGTNLYLNSIFTDGETEIKLDMNYAFLFGEKSNALTDPNDSTKTLFTTGGVDWYAENAGYTESYNTGAMALSDIENVIQNLKFEKAPAKQIILAGVTAGLDIDRVMKALNDTGGGINYAEMGIGSVKDRTLDFGIDGFRHGNYTFMKKSLDGLNEQGIANGGTGATNVKWPKTAYVLPWGDTVDANGKAIQRVSIRYMESTQEGSRYMKAWTRDKTITNSDVVEFNHQAEAGFQVFMARQINKLYV